MPKFAANLSMMFGETPFIDRFAAAACAGHGLRLLIEPINTFDIPGYFLSGSRQAVAILDEGGADNLFLQYDIYHMQRMEGELANTMHANLGYDGWIGCEYLPGGDTVASLAWREPWLQHS